MNAFVELAGRKSRQASERSLRDREIVQGPIGRMDALHRAARAFLIECHVGTSSLGRRRVRVCFNARAVLRTACTHAAESAVRIVDMLAAETGAAAIFETLADRGLRRDVHAAVKHIAMTPNNYVVSGRSRSASIPAPHGSESANGRDHDALRPSAST